LDLAGAYIQILLAFESGKAALAAQDWNIGPDPEDVLTVQDVITKIQTAWKPTPIELVDASHSEASSLLIDSTKAKNLLGWRPRLSSTETIEWVAEWYKEFYEQSANPVDLTLRQIRAWLAR
jgi:CDP-glucose 4,6-dehydratase